MSLINTSDSNQHLKRTRVIKSNPTNIVFFVFLTNIVNKLNLVHVGVKRALAESLP